MAGAGRAKLRLSRGFPGCLAYDVTPIKVVQEIGGSRHMAGAGRAKIGLSRGFPGCLAHDITPHKRWSEKLGITSYGRGTRETPAQADLRPTNFLQLLIEFETLSHSVGSQ
jgi:hypothetical protein